MGREVPSSKAMLGRGPACRVGTPVEAKVEATCAIRMHFDQTRWRKSDPKC